MLVTIGGDRDLFTQLLDLFLERYPVMLRDIQDAVRAQDADKLQYAAHALKGTAGTLCASDVVTIADHLETLGRVGNLGTARELSRLLEEKVLVLVDILRRMR